jgi:CHAT domain-containing protein
LNFETLPVPDPSRHYLIEDAVVSIAPSLNLIAARAERPRIPGSLLLIGDPETTDPLYAKLPFASQEIDAVGRHFAASRIQEFRSHKAIPAAYRKSAVRPFSCVHFTAHATSNRENPLDSAIILSASPEGYKLTANSVLQERLDAGLVTLSACHTAGARTYAGEGLVGFTWAFLQAGAHNVIAGLWDVSDESTPKLMDQLYTGLAAGQDHAQALTAAKRALLHGPKPYNLPYYWAPFQLYVGHALACPAKGCN